MSDCEVCASDVPLTDRLTRALRDVDRLSGEVVALRNAVADHMEQRRLDGFDGTDVALWADAGLMSSGMGDTGRHVCTTTELLAAVFDAVSDAGCELVVDGGGWRLVPMVRPVPPGPDGWRSGPAVRDWMAGR